MFRRRHAAVTPRIAVHTRDGELQPRVRLVELSPAAQAALLRLDPLADRREYAEAIDQLDRLRAAIEAGTAEGGTNLMERAQHFVDGGGDGEVHRDLMLRIGNLGLASWSVWAGLSTAVVDSIVGGAQVTVADLGALPTDDERAALTLGVLEHLWSHRDDRIPTLDRDRRGAHGGARG